MSLYVVVPGKVWFGRAYVPVGCADDAIDSDGASIYQRARLCFLQATGRCKDQVQPHISFKCGISEYNAMYDVQRLYQLLMEGGAPASQIKIIKICSPVQNIAADERMEPIDPTGFETCPIN